MLDLFYALVQLIHNLGAASVVGSPAVAVWLAQVNRVNTAVTALNREIEPVQHKLALLTLIAWSLQLVSGAGFGASSYYFKHAFPELTGIGLAALVIKVVCAIICLTLALLYWRRGSRWSKLVRFRVWQTLFVLGLTALMSAAFLRWYG